MISGRLQGCQLVDGPGNLARDATNAGTGVGTVFAGRA